LFPCGCDDRRADLVGEPRGLQVPVPIDLRRTREHWRFSGCTAEEKPEQRDREDTSEGEEWAHW
jgi:hypothetical protein